MVLEAVGSHFGGCGEGRFGMLVQVQVVEGIGEMSSSDWGCLFGGLRIWTRYCLGPGLLGGRTLFNIEDLSALAAKSLTVIMSAHSHGDQSGSQAEVE